MEDPDRTASLMTPTKLQRVKPRAAASPAQWLDQMAADAGSLHVRRIGELRGDLMTQATARDCALVSQQLALLEETLPKLDFSLLQTRGWWARTTGKSKSAGAEFASQFEQIDQATRALASQALALQKTQQAAAAATDRTLMELEVEYRAIDTIIDQGARWLQDMRTQLKARHAEAADPEALRLVKDDAARCEILVARLKLLRAASSASQQAHQQAQGAAARRAALVQMLQQAVASDLKAWHVRLSALATAAGDSSGPALGVEGPMETHRELQLCVKQARTDCDQLLAQESAMAQSVQTLGQQLDAAA
ncbi:MAG: hypothetical protein HYX47_08265 [Burkholderiales bacterium]|nr:hypothetical protein [Burkholderiales bacterium]